MVEGDTSHRSLRVLADMGSALVSVRILRAHSSSRRSRSSAVSQSSLTGRPTSVFQLNTFRRSQRLRTLSGPALWSSPLGPSLHWDRALLRIATASRRVSAATDSRGIDTGSDRGRFWRRRVSGGMAVPVEGWAEGRTAETISGRWTFRNRRGSPIPAGLGGAGTSQEVSSDRWLSGDVAEGERLSDGWTTGFLLRRVTVARGDA